MKQSQINRAYKALRNMLNLELPFSEAYKLHALATKLKTNYVFEIEQEEKLIRKYSGSILEDGKLVFPSSENADAFQRDIAELCDVDIDIEISPVTINCSYLSSQRMTALDIMNLEGFVVFEE